MIGFSSRQRRVAFFSAVLALACICALLVLGPLRPRLSRIAKRALKVDWIDSDRTAPSGTQYRTFFSRTIGREVSYLIYLPPDYESAPEKRYPVIYWLHSRGGTQREGAGTFLPRLDAAIRSGRVRPAIAVFPNGLFDSRWLDSPDGKRPMESVIVGDLIPHVDNTYRTIAARRARAVEGFSMGGFGAALLGFKHPEVFGVVSILSGALFDESNNEEFLEANSPWNLVARNAKGIRGRTVVRMAAGDKDPLLQFIQKYHLLLKVLEIEHDYTVLPGIGHNEEMIYAGLGEGGIAFYARVFGQGNAEDGLNK